MSVKFSRTVHRGDQSHTFLGLGFDPLSNKVVFPQLGEAELAEFATSCERFLDSSRRFFNSVRITSL
jgi:hypothetical protein